MDRFRCGVALVASILLHAGCAGQEARSDPSPEPIRPAASDTPDPSPAESGAGEAAPFDPSPFMGTDWYGLYLHGEKVGYATISVAPGGDAGVPTVVSETRAILRVLAAGKRVEAGMEQRSTYAAAGSQGLLEKRELKVTGGMTVERVGAIEGNQFVVRTRRAAGDPTLQAFPLPGETLGDHFAPQVLARSGAAPGTKRVALEFGLDHGRDSKTTYEVIGTEEVFTGGVPAKIVLVRHGRAKDRALRLTMAGKVLELEWEGLLRVRSEPEELAKDLRYSSDLFLKGLLRADRRLGPPRDLRALDLRLMGTDPALDLPSGGRQIVVREEGGALRVTLRTEVPPDLLPGVTEMEAARFLLPAPGMPVDHEEIRELALQAAGDAATPREKVRRFVLFVEGHIEDAIRLESVPVPLLLRDRRGDCTEHTDLFLALCRTSGIPARAVTGLMYAGDALGGFGSHRWAEVALEGRWVSADPTWGEFPVDASHIALEFGESVTNTLRLLSGRITVEVVSGEAER